MKLMRNRTRGKQSDCYKERADERREAEAEIDAQLASVEVVDVEEAQRSEPRCPIQDIRSGNSTDRLKSGILTK